MSLEKLSEVWLFELNTKEELTYWVNNLTFFHFKRAWGGHAGDGDEFSLSISFNDKNDLIDKLSQLGISLKSISKDAPKVVYGKEYSTDEYCALKNEIKKFPELEQPGHCKIHQEEVFVWINNDYFKINISGSKDKNYYQVTNLDFEKAKRIESIIIQLDLAKSVYEDNYYVCSITRERYPELFH